MNRLLFVDDDETILHQLLDYFCEDYIVYTASCVDDAIEQIEKQSFDCIISDVNMKGKTGFDLVSYVKKKYSEIPILLLSGLTEEEMILKGFDLGASDYVRKPFSFAELKARISSRLKRNNGEFTFGDLVINEASAQVSFKGKNIPLTSMEFDILLLLVKNKGKTFSKEQIYDTIWKQEPLDQMHTVQVHMFTLRKKLQDVTGLEIIKTIWKKGYIFDYKGRD